jgi:hypothetical protein
LPVALTLRDRVSEQERFAIEAYYYYEHVTGELEKAVEATESAASASSAMIMNTLAKNSCKTV